MLKSCLRLFKVRFRQGNKGVRLEARGTSKRGNWTGSSNRQRAVGNRATVRKNDAATREKPNAGKHYIPGSKSEAARHSISVAFKSFHLLGISKDQRERIAIKPEHAGKN
jgi:hypothetical protein